MLNQTFILMCGSEDVWTSLNVFNNSLSDLIVKSLKPNQWTSCTLKYNADKTVPSTHIDTHRRRISFAV